MRERRTRLGVVLLALALVAPGCGRHVGSGSFAPRRAAAIPTVKSVSPASVAAPPMAKTPILPASMMSMRRPKAVIQPVGFTQLPGGATFVTASPDGSIWVVSSLGAGPDRSIWHYVNGTWTNIPGAATRLAVGPDGTLWAVNSSGGIYAYDGSAWSTIAGGASDISVGADGSVYVISNQGGGPYGRGIWQYTGGSWTQLPGAAVRVAASWDTGENLGNLDPGGVWVVNARDEIYYYMSGYGFMRMQGGVVEISPTKHAGLFALGHTPNADNSYPIYYLDLTSGAWTIQAGAAVSIATNTTNVYAVGSAGGIYTAPVGPPPDTPGTIREFSVGISAKSGLHAIVPGADGNIWFTEPFLFKIAKITTTGAVSEFGSGISQTGALIGGMTAGPDGNMWFTEYYFGFPNPADVNRIDKITPAGFVTEYTAGITANSNAIMIAAGPDGNMWFTESALNQVGKITTSGAATEYSAGISPASGPYYITAGPDGNVWFSEINQSAKKVGKITPAGVVTEYSTGASGMPGPIITGPDGNIWFAGNGITKMTTSGVPTQYLAGTQTDAIAPGPDGNIWFAVNNPSPSIGQMTTDGTLLAQYSTGLSLYAQIVGLAAGADNAMWFTDLHNNHIGRVTIGANPHPSPPPGAGSVVVTPASFSFSNVGAAYSLTASVSQSGFAGPFALSNANAAIATTSILNSTITVTPAGAGSTTLRVTGGSGHFADVPITVTTNGALVASPTSLSFTDVGAAANQSVVVTQGGYAGPFVVSSIDSSVATASVNGNSITVTPVGGGATTMRVTGNGQFVDVPIGVTVSNIIIHSRRRGAR
jgi:streptogramin lyase